MAIRTRDSLKTYEEKRRALESQIVRAAQRAQARMDRLMEQAPEWEGPRITAALVDELRTLCVVTDLYACAAKRLAALRDTVQASTLEEGGTRPCVH